MVHRILNTPLNLNIHKVANALGIGLKILQCKTNLAFKFEELNNFNATTARKMSKYAVFPGPYFPALLHKSTSSVQIQENTDQKKKCMWTLFTQWTLVALFVFSKSSKILLFFSSCYTLTKLHQSPPWKKNSHTNNIHQ